MQYRVSGPDIQTVRTTALQLSAAIADKQQWEELLRAGLNAAAGEMYYPLKRCIFQLHSYQWHALMEGGVR